MSGKNIFSSDLVAEYCYYFREISLQSIFVKESELNFKSVEFPNGALLEVRVQWNKNSSNFTLSNILHTKANSLREALNEIQVNVGDYLPKHQNRNLIKAVKYNVPYLFKGTIIFYNDSIDKIYLIKEKKVDLWTVEAARTDIKQLITDIPDFPP